MEAFEGLDSNWRLVLAGSNGYGAAEILARIAASPARDRVHVTGYISPEELAQWYARAAIFAFPSLDEGFGMPVLSAMAAGVPVVTSDRSALPEVAGDAALLVDPENMEAIRHAMQQLTGSVDLRDEELDVRSKMGTGEGEQHHRRIAPNQVLAQIHAAGQLLHCMTDRLRVFGVHQDCGVSRHFRQRRAVGGHDRNACGHGFQQRHAETFVERRKSKDRRSAYHPASSSG